MSAVWDTLPPRRRGIRSLSYAFAAAEGCSKDPGRRIVDGVLVSEQGGKSAGSAGYVLNTDTHVFHRVCGRALRAGNAPPGEVLLRLLRGVCGAALFQVGLRRQKDLLVRGIGLPREGHFQRGGRGRKLERDFANEFLHWAIFMV